MTPDTPSRERWQVLEPLLDAALELDAAERGHFLDAACGGDTAIRSELESLLTACELGEGILERPAAIAFAPLLIEPEQPVPTLVDGRYHVVREIGRGGMGTVYLADDPKHGRQVAVKTLHAEIARIVGRERFAREIEIAAGLSHPHILPLYDSGEDAAPSPEPSLLYFVSPYAAGESLRHRLQREERLDPAEVLRLGHEIALALDYAHRQGVVHLDVKPENILLHEGHAVVADFGIARAMSSAGKEDDTAAPFLGTPSYMSPEQRSNEPDVDGRSDIYSLGCVLYELITGERAESAPSEATLQRYVPAELSDVVMRAMAPSRDDRFASAGDLAAALGGTGRRPTRRRWRRTRLLVGGAAALAVVGGIAWRSRGVRVLDADLVAVAPFDVTSPSLALWKEGLVDVMSRGLDGAGPLRTVPASLVMRHWTPNGRGDASSARALGEATGARLVVFGGLLAAGDSVRAMVYLYDAQTGRPVAEIERRDLVSRIDRLSDSLSLAVLREVGGSRRIDMAHAISSPTVSLPALKAYLQGEQFYRAALWDSAQVHFEHALVLDTTFALAYHRLAAVLRWRDAKDIPDSLPYVLMRRTSQFPRGLGPRERLLATVDSLSSETYFAWRRGFRTSQYGTHESLVRQLYGTLTAGLRRFPGDAELAFLLADARSRYENDVVVGEIDDRATLALYDRAIALDSGFAPAYVTPMTLAAYLDDAARARRYARAYLQLNPAGPHSRIMRLGDAMLDPARAGALDARRLVDTLPPDALCMATALLRHLPDSAELAMRIGRALAARSAGASAPQVGPTCALVNVVDALQFRGHLREAHRLTSLGVHWLGPAVMYSMTRAGMVPAETSRAEFARVLALAPKTRMTQLYGWWATDGDTAAIRRYVDGFAARQHQLRTPSGEAMLRASVAAGRAYLALAKRDTATALRRLLATKDTLHECWYENRVTLVQLLLATHRYHEAAERLDRRWPGTTACSNGFDDVLWTMERARVAERLGRRDRAAADYAFVAEAWGTADPELQRYVSESRTAIARLKALNDAAMHAAAVSSAKRVVSGAG